MKPHDAVRLGHMLEAAREAREFASGRAREHILRDRQLLLALVRLLEIIGEAAAQTSEECQQSHPQIEWGAIIGMRNRLVHGYFDINRAIVWQPVEELPSLMHSLEDMLGE